MRSRRSLRTELLVNLGFVTSAAVILVGLNTVLLLGGDLTETWRPLVALWLGSTTPVLALPVYALAASRWVAAEETRMTERFGPEWDAYRASVRRWL